MFARFKTTCVFLTVLLSPGAMMAATPADYEVRGFFGAGDDLEVSVRETSGGPSRWMKVGRKAEPVWVESADAKTGAATLVVNGVRRKLRLQSEKPAEAPLAATKENFEALRARQVELLEKPGVGELLNAVMLSTKGEFEKAHPEYAEIQAREKATWDRKNLSEEDKQTVVAYDKLHSEANALVLTRLRQTGDADLIEAVRLGEQAQAMLRQNPEVLNQGFELGHRAAYGAPAGKSVSAPAPKTTPEVQADSESAK